MWYDWSAHFSKMFRTFPGILQYHHLRFHVTNLGILLQSSMNTLQKYSKANLSSRGLTLAAEGQPSNDQMPSTITLCGMCFEHQQYLFDKIRSSEAADLACTKPFQQELCSVPSVLQKLSLGFVVIAANLAMLRSFEERSLVQNFNNSLWNTCIILTFCTVYCTH